MLCAFCFFMFGIIAVQLFAGVLRNRWGARHGCCWDGDGCRGRFR